MTMLGNSKGWIIAAVLAGVLALLTQQALEFNRITPPTDLAADLSVLQPLKLDVDPATIIAMDQPGDSTTLYRNAIADVTRQKARYEKYSEEGTSTSVADLPAIQEILDAAPLTPAPLLAPNLSGNIAYVAESDELAALALAAKCCERLGLLNRTPDPALSKKCFEADLAVGAKLFDERITYYEAFDGVGMMRGATAGLKILAGDAKDDAQVTKLAAFDDSTAAMAKKLARLWDVIGSIDPNQIATHAGDVYFFTTPEMKERMWRIEATLKLGRHRFNVSRLADATAAGHRLTEMKATEKDPALQTAVQAADSLTLQDYRMIR